MNKIINIKLNKAIKEIREFRDKLFSQCDIRFTNVHMKKLNKIINVDLFSKNDLYINSTTLFELMQPIGNAGSHNYHELTPEDILNALNSIIDPLAVFSVKYERYAVVPVYNSSFNEPLMVVIETNAPLLNRQNANINKIVTIYPKSGFDKYLESIKNEDMLYKK